MEAFYDQAAHSFHYHRRHHCQRTYSAGPPARAQQRRAAGPSSGAQRPVQHRQHRPRPGTLADDGPRHSGKLRPVRWFHHLPRHRYAGLFRSGTFLPHPERGQAHHPHRCPAAHLQRDHRRQEKPARQRDLCTGPGQPGRDGGVWRARHCRHPCQKEQDHQLRRLCLGQLPAPP